MIDLRRILVPTDFSKHSHNALKYAVAFAEKFGAELHLLHNFEVRRSPGRIWERRAAGEQAIQGSAQAVQVARRPDRGALTRGLFGAHEAGSSSGAAHDGAGIAPGSEPSISVGVALYCEIPGAETFCQTPVKNQRVTKRA